MNKKPLVVLLFLVMVTACTYRPVEVKGQLVSIEESIYDDIVHVNVRVSSAKTLDSQKTYEAFLDAGIAIDVLKEDVDGLLPGDNITFICQINEFGGIIEKSCHIKGR